MIVPAAVGAALAGILLIFTCYQTLARRAFTISDLVVVVVLFTNVAALGMVAILRLAGNAWEDRLLWIGGLAMTMSPCLMGAGWAVEQVAKQEITSLVRRLGWIATGFLCFPACVFACALPAEIAWLFAQQVHEYLWLAILGSGLSAMLAVRAYTLYRRGKAAVAQNGGAGAGAA